MNWIKKLFYNEHELIGTVQQIGAHAGERCVYLVKNHKGKVIRAYVKAQTYFGMDEVPIDPTLAQQKKIIRI